jgi:hypothetical protein
MKYILLLEYDTGDQAYFVYEKLSHAKTKMAEMKRHMSNSIEHCSIVEVSKTLIHWHWTHACVSITDES